MYTGDWYSMGAINWHRVLTTEPCALFQGLGLATPIPPLSHYLSTLGPGKIFGSAPGEPTATAGLYGVHRGARKRRAPIANSEALQTSSAHPRHRP